MKVASSTIAHPAPYSAHDALDRLPLPEEQRQDQARRQHVGAALDRARHKLRPPALEARPCHDAVLHGEEPEQQHIHRQREAHRPGRARIDRLGHEKAAHEADRVEEND